MSVGFRKEKIKPKSNLSYVIKQSQNCDKDIKEE